MELKNIVVIGTGTMGSGIAYASAIVGYQVSIVDQNQDMLDNGMNRIKQKVKKGIERGKLSPAEGEKIIAGINPSLELSEVASNADLVIEAVYENMAIKKDIFKELNKHVSDTAILASNTSMLSITEMAGEVKNPERVIGMHFFNPPEAMKLVEIIIGDDTSNETKELSIEYVKSIRKDFIIAKDSPGFIVNRISVPVLIEALRVVDTGIASIEDVDKAMTMGMNYPIGPFALADVVGLDVSLAVIETMEREFGDCYNASETLKKLVNEGKLGVKTGEGFYKYT